MIKYANNYPFCIELVNDQVVRKKSYCYNKGTFAFYQAIINHFINYPSDLVVPVYSFSFKEKVNNYYQYSYDMKRLGILSKEEKEVIKLITTLTEWELADPNLNWMRRNYSPLIHFLNRVISENNYDDLHFGNILKDEYDNYLLIDLEGFNPKSPLGLSLMEKY